MVDQINLYDYIKGEKLVILNVKKIRKDRMVVGKTKAKVFYLHLQNGDVVYVKKRTNIGKVLDYLYDKMDVNKPIEITIIGEEKYGHLRYHIKYIFYSKKEGV